jgi:hypothetical protein
MISLCLDTPSGISILAGYEYGRQLWETQATSLNINDYFTIHFSNEIESMSSSFIDGFFAKAIETIGVENLINRLHVIGNDYLDHHIKEILSEYIGG